MAPIIAKCNGQLNWNKLMRKSMHLVGLSHAYIKTIISVSVKFGHIYAKIMTVPLNKHSSINVTEHNADH
jgi:hypothetical protein